jgi:hypothetical protein
MKNPKPWGVRVLMGDGVPTYLNHKPSRAMLAAMQAAMTTSRAYSPERATETALAYVRWLAERDGITLPKETAGRTPGRFSSDGTRLEVEWGYVETPGKSWRSGQRIRALRWVDGIYSEYRDVQRIRRGKPVTISERCEPYWVPDPDKTPLRIEIPNWDHVPNVLSERELCEVAA